MLAADLTATVNPLLRPTAATVAHAVERWADEDAAQAVADRRVAARTLARTALLMHRHRPAAPTPAVGVLGADVPGRVEALLAPPPRRRPLVAVALTALTLTCVLGGRRCAAQRRTPLRTRQRIRVATPSSIASAVTMNVHRVGDTPRVIHRFGSC